MSEPSNQPSRADVTSDETREGDLNEADDAEQLSPPPQRHPLIGRLLQVLRIVAVLAVLAAVAYAVIKDWAAVEETIGQMNPWLLAASLLCACVAAFAPVGVWRTTLAGSGTKIKPLQGCEVYLVGQLARYIPGSVWAFLLQAQLGKRYRIPRMRSLLALLTTLLIVAITGLLLSILALPLYRDRWGSVAYLLLLAPLALIALAPPVLNRILNLVLRVTRRPPLEQPISARTVLTACGWAFVHWAIFGLHLWLLVIDTPGGSDMSYPQALATFSLAVCAGFVAFLLPSGVGVREGVIVVSLTAVMPGGAALAVALVSRLISTAADVVGAGVSIAASRFVERRELANDQPGTGTSSGA